MAIGFISANQLIAHIKSAVSHAAPSSPAFTMILGAGFSSGLVPLTNQMMREEIGLWMASTSGGPQAQDTAPALAANFWREFNRLNAKRILAVASPSIRMVFQSTLRPRIKRSQRRRRLMVSARSNIHESSFGRWSQRDVGD